MSKNKKKNSNKTLVLFAIILIILTTAFSCIGYYAWAKYTKSKQGDAAAQVAKWHFELTPGSKEGTPRSNFAYTRTDGYGDVATDKLAPGTFGIIPIEIDTTKTEVTMVYDIKVQIQNCPKNVVFYTDEAKTKALSKTEINENTIELEISKYLPLGELNKKHDETIYWNWPYQTYESDGAGGQSTTKGDVQDTNDQGKDVSITISATGTEVLDEQVPLKESTIKVGDKIRYQIDNNTTINGIVVKNTNDEVEFMLVDNDGKAKPLGSLRLGYKEGTTADTAKAIEEATSSWNNSVQLINNTAIEGFKDTYGFYGASRALSIEDANRLVGYIPSPSPTQYTYTSSIIRGGDNKFIVDKLTMVKTTTDKDMLATDLEGISVGDTITIGNTYGNDQIKSITVIGTTGESTNLWYNYNDNYSAKSNISSYLGSNVFWLASRCVNFNNNYYAYCAFSVRYYERGAMSYCNFYNSDCRTYNVTLPAVPVISISSNTLVKAEATGGEWVVRKW